MGSLNLVKIARPNTPIKYILSIKITIIIALIIIPHSESLPIFIKDIAGNSMLG